MVLIQDTRNRVLVTYASSVRKTHPLVHFSQFLGAASKDRRVAPADTDSFTL